MQLTTKLFFLLLFVSLSIGILSFHNVFAERGLNYDKNEIILNNNLHQGTFQSYTNNYTLDSDGSYKPYSVLITNDHVNFQSSRISFTYYTNDCSIKIFQGGLITKDSIPTINSYNWILKQTPFGIDNYVSSPENQVQCKTSIINNGDYFEITGIKASYGISNQTNFIFKTKYSVKAGGVLEASASWINNDSTRANDIFLLTDSQTGIPQDINTNIPSTDQIIDNTVISDKITILPEVGNTLSFQTDMTNSIIYDYGTAKQYLVKTGYIPSSVDKTIFNDYLYSDKPIPLGKEAIIDPTFGFNSGTNYQVVTTQTISPTCGVPTTKQSGAFNDVTIPNSTANSACTRMAYQFSIGQLNNTIVDQVSLQFNITSTNGSINCSINNISDKPADATANTLWNDISSGNSFVSNSSLCSAITSNSVLDLGSNGVSSLQTRINNAVTNNWFAVGIKASNETRSGLNSFTFAPNSVKLAVNYHTLTPSKPLNVLGVGHPNKNTITYTAPNSRGSSNVTNYNLYSEAFPFAKTPLPDLQGIDPTSYSSIINMSKNKVLLHLDGINSIQINQLNDTSGNNLNFTGFAKRSFFFTNETVHYSFNETSGTLARNSATSPDKGTKSLGSNADGTHQAGVSAGQPGLIGNSVLYHGGTAIDYTIAGSSTTQFAFLDNDTAFRINVWLKFVNVNTANNQAVLNEADGLTPGDSGFAWYVPSGTSNMRVVIQNGGANYIDLTVVNAVPDTTSWHMYTVAFDPTNATKSMSLFRDGSLLGTVGHVGISPATRSTALHISDHSTNNVVKGCDCYMDELMMWAFKAPRNDINAFYNNGIGFNGVSPKIEPGLFSNAMNFTGTTRQQEYLSINTTANMPSGTKSWSISSWDKAGFYSVNNPLNLLSFTTSQNQTTISVNATYGSVYVNSLQLQCAISRKINDWNFDVFTYDGSTFKYYNNGTLACSSSSSSGIGSPVSNEYVIGAKSGKLTRFANAILDEYSIFVDRVLTQTDITNMWMRGTSNTMSLVKEVGNVTTINHTGLGNGTGFYYRVQAINSNGNGTISDPTNATTSVLPSAPVSVNPLVVNLNRIDVSCVPPTSNGHDPIQSYKLLRNGTILVNSTTSLCTNYTDTPIDILHQQTYSICAWNGVGCGTYRSANSSTVTTSSGFAYINKTVVGNVIGITPRVFTITGIPDPVAVNVLLYNYTTLLQNQTISKQLIKGNTVYLPFTFYKTITTTVSNFTSKVKITNTTGFVTLTSNFTTASSSYSYPGSLNYTVSRPNPFSTLHLNVLRQPITFQLECNYKTGAFDHGTWHNYTKIGFYNRTDPVSTTATIYISCYNDQLLFSIISYGSFNGTSLMQSFTGAFGNFLGVNVVFLFVVLLAAIFTGRSSSTGLIFVTAAIGIMSFLGFFTNQDGTPQISNVIWGFIVVLTSLGMMAAKKYF